MLPKYVDAMIVHNIQKSTPTDVLYENMDMFIYMEMGQRLVRRELSAEKFIGSI